MRKRRLLPILALSASMAFSAVAFAEEETSTEVESVVEDETQEEENAISICDVATIKQILYSTAVITATGAEINNENNSVYFVSDENCESVAFLFVDENGVNLCLGSSEAQEDGSAVFTDTDNPDTTFTYMI